MLALLLSFDHSAAAIDRSRYFALTNELRERAKQKDWQGAREVLARMGRELPAATPRYMLTVASVEARLGHQAEALGCADSPPPA